MPPDSRYQLETKIYNLDCREVARGTQSAFSCLCSYSAFDIAKALYLNSVLCPKWPQVLEKVDV